jgi:hypothetical protein
MMTGMGAVCYRMRAGVKVAPLAQVDRATAF